MSWFGKKLALPDTSRRTECCQCVHWGQTHYGGPFGVCCKVRGSFVRSDEDQLPRFVRDDEEPDSLLGQGGGARWPETWAHARCDDFVRYHRWKERDK